MIKYLVVANTEEEANKYIYEHRHEMNKENSLGVTPSFKPNFRDYILVDITYNLTPIDTINLQRLRSMELNCK